MSTFIASFLILSVALVLVPVSSMKNQTIVKIKFLNDFLANENIPSTVVVKASQWSMSDMVEFSKRVDSSVKFIRTGKVIKKSLGENINTVLFFIDMKSEGSVEFLLNVCMSQCKFREIRSNKYSHYFQTPANYYGSPYRWILYDIDENQINAIGHQDFPIDSFVLLVVSKGSQTFHIQHSNHFFFILMFT